MRARAGEKKGEIATGRGNTGPPQLVQWLREKRGRRCYQEQKKEIKTKRKKKKAPRGTRARRRALPSGQPPPPAQCRLGRAHRHVDRAAAEAPQGCRPPRPSRFVPRRPRARIEAARRGAAKIRERIPRPRRGLAQTATTKAPRPPTGRRRPSTKTRQGRPQRTPARPCSLRRRTGGGKATPPRPTPAERRR